MAEETKPEGQGAVSKPPEAPKQDSQPPKFPKPSDDLGGESKQQKEEERLRSQAHDVRLSELPGERGEMEINAPRPALRAAQERALKIIDELVPSDDETVDLSTDRLVQALKNLRVRVQQGAVTEDKLADFITSAHNVIQNVGKPKNRSARGFEREPEKTPEVAQRDLERAIYFVEKTG